MSQSYSPNSLLQIKPNVFLKARIRNIRWKRDMTINVDTGSVGASDQVIPYDPDATPAPVINNQNENLDRIKDRYNK
jgi:hypothetical protein